MAFAQIKARSAGRDDARVYADLGDLIKLEHRAIGFSFLPSQPVHNALTGRYQSRLRGRGLNFEELRHYRPGDDIRTIDWKATARTRQPHVRVYGEERDRPAWLLVDQRISMFFGTRERMKAVTAAHAAALVAWRTLAVGDRVGAVVFNDSSIVEFAPRRHRKQVHRILEAVVAMNHRLAVADAEPAEPGQYNRAMERIVTQAKHDAFVCSISDGFGVNEQTRRLATRLTRHNDLMALFIYDPFERDLPSGHRLLLSDGAGELEIDTRSRSLRRRYTDDFESRRAAIEGVSRRQRIPILRIHTGASVEQQLQALLASHLKPPNRGRR